MLPGGAFGAGVFNSPTLPSMYAAFAWPPGALFWTVFRAMPERSLRETGFRPEVPEGSRMEALLSHLIHFALWAFFVMFAFAAIGVIAVVRWIVNLVTRTEAAVGSEVDVVERAIHKH